MVLPEGCPAEEMGTNQPRDEDLAASLRNYHASQLQRVRME